MSVLPYREKEQQTTDYSSNERVFTRSPLNTSSSVDAHLSKLCSGSNEQKFDEGVLFDNPKRCSDISKALDTSLYSSADVVHCPLVAPDYQGQVIDMSVALESTETRVAAGRHVCRQHEALTVYTAERQMGCRPGGEDSAGG